MMTVTYLPVNQAYCVLFGSGPVSKCSMIDIDGIFIWPNREDLVLTLKYRGLDVSKAGIVSTSEVKNDF